LVGLGKAQGLVFDLCFYRAEALENFCKKIWNLGNRGGYYDPPYSAECQILSLDLFTLTATRDKGVSGCPNKIPTKYQHFGFYI
ncbi:hypothetical protein, partial [Enterococcus sp. DIV2381]|uniref:hypothetical protein n=1 Tax=unclassified Enterococcus TaxID=2608891 RepID=UPI003D29E665